LWRDLDTRMGVSYLTKLSACDIGHYCGCEAGVTYTGERSVMGSNKRNCLI
jgi:hypothetical protein